MKPIATLFLGGIEDGEYGEIDIEISHRKDAEAMQEKLVTTAKDVLVPLYALDVDALRDDLLAVMRYESRRMGAVSAAVLKRALARLAGE